MTRYPHTGPERPTSDAPGSEPDTQPRALSAGSHREARTDGGAAGTVRVGTYNVRYAGIDEGQFAWEQRRDAVVTAIRRADADVMALQEVWLEQLPDLRDRLNYEWIAHPDASGPHTPLAYEPTRFTVVDDGTFGLAPGGERGVVAWDAHFQRLVTYATLRDRQTDRTFTVFSVHFDHEGTTARRESARLLTDRLPDGPCVVAGDYNCESGSEPYRRLAEPLIDTAHRAADRQGPRSTYVGFGRSDEDAAAANRDDPDGRGGADQDDVGPSTPIDRRRLDHLFARGFDVQRHRVCVPDGLASDHRPVVTDLVME